jgi:hypothetical protein
MRATHASLLFAPVFVAAIIVPWPEPASPQPAAAPSSAAADTPVMPQYDAARALRLPERYREWVFVGSSLGLSYDEGASDHEMFAETLMEPTAYRHFVKTGEFREGTMLALLLHGADKAVLPGRRGQFGGAVHGVEMAVKDRTRTPAGWAYYGFGGMGSIAKTAQPSGSGCVSCHRQHAARDHVFLQFYPLLAEAAGITVATRRAAVDGAPPHPLP